MKTARAEFSDGTDSIFHNCIAEVIHGQNNYRLAFYAVIRVPRGTAACAKNPVIARIQQMTLQPIPAIRARHRFSLAYANMRACLQIRLITLWRRWKQPASGANSPGRAALSWRTCNEISRLTSKAIDYDSSRRVYVPSTPSPSQLWQNKS